MAGVRDPVRPGPDAGDPTGPTPVLPVRRADIDGLRAVAVAGVIAFHFGFGPFTGGFIGVDVFFVISGFLIASILRGSDIGPALLPRFAERRVRRILPALLAVVAACCLLSTTLLPNDLKPVGLGLVTAVAFIANHYFASLAGDYFAAGALAINPSLHLWSLGVEAQFYLVAALLWAAGRRWPAWRAGAIAALTAASFAFSLWGVAARPVAAFYLLPSRFWEFMAGAVLILPLSRPAGSRGAAAAVATGLGLIALGCLLLTARAPFPGAAALLPCLGAALVIAGGSSANAASRLLGSRPLALAGRLSYSLYLWHWPVLVFASYGQATPLPAIERAGLLALTLLLAALTYRFVERPFIERRWLPRPRPFLIACAAGTLGVALAGLALNLAGQNIVTLSRLPPDVLRLANGQFDSVDLRCPAGLGGDPGCRFGAPEGEPTVAVWGNSFARMWMPALAEAAARHRAGGVALLIVRCPPLLGVAFPALPGCERFNRDALATIDAHPSLRTVVLGGDWSAWPDELPALRATVDALRARGRRVVLVLSPPAVLYAVPRTLALAALRHHPPPPLVEDGEAREKTRSETALADALRADAGVTVVDPFDALCDGRTCAVQAEGRPLYYDDRHVTRFTAARAAGLFEPVFAEAGPP